jgi:hypothetical protein
MDMVNESIPYTHHTKQSYDFWYLVSSSAFSGGKNGFFICRIHHVVLAHNHQENLDSHVNIRGGSLEPHVNMLQKASGCLVVVVDKFTYPLHLYHFILSFLSYHNHHDHHHDHHNDHYDHNQIYVATHQIEVYVENLVPLEKDNY